MNILSEWRIQTMLLLFLAVNSFLPSTKRYQSVTLRVTQFMQVYRIQKISQSDGFEH